MFTLHLNKQMCFRRTAVLKNLALCQKSKVGLPVSFPGGLPCLAKLNTLENLDVYFVCFYMFGMIGRMPRERRNMEKLEWAAIFFDKLVFGKWKVWHARQVPGKKRSMVHKAQLVILR